MCDSNTPEKLLSQFVVDQNDRLLLNDLDAVPLVDKSQGKLGREECRNEAGLFWLLPATLQGYWSSADTVLFRPHPELVRHQLFRFSRFEKPCQFGCWTTLVFCRSSVEIVLTRCLAPEQVWPFADRPFVDQDMPPYDEKTDMYVVTELPCFSPHLLPISLSFFHVGICPAKAGSCLWRLSASLTATRLGIPLVNSFPPLQRLVCSG